MLLDIQVEDLNSAAQRYVLSNDWTPLQQLLAEDDRALLKILYNVVTSPGQEYRTIEQVLDASKFQEQFQVTAASVNKILADSKIGLSKLETLLEPVELLTHPLTGKEILLGGFHRLATLSLLCTQGDVERDDFMAQVIPVSLKTIDVDALSVKTGYSVDDPRLEKRVNELISALWLSSNSTRAVTSPEKQYHNVAKLGVNVTDVDDVLRAYARGALNAASASTYLYSIEAEGVLEMGTESSPSVHSYMWTIGEGKALQPSRTNQDKLLASFLSKLKKVKESEDSRTNKYTYMVSSPEGLHEIMSNLLVTDDVEGLTLIESACVQYFQSDVPFRYNIGQNISGITDVLLELYLEQDFPILLKPSAPRSQKKAKAVEKNVSNKLLSTGALM
jgi:hypothetical protein